MLPGLYFGRLQDDISSFFQSIKIKEFPTNPKDLSEEDRELLIEGIKLFKEACNTIVSYDDSLSDFLSWLD
jgi:hypothetical protein